MITQLLLRNFRSIESKKFDFAPITVFYGATSAGKSSVLYSLCVLRNFILNPNQAPDALFHLGFLNLGGFEACARNHDLSSEMTIHATMDMDGSPGHYGIELGKASAKIEEGFPDMALRGAVTMPYALNQSFQIPYKGKTGDFKVNWNGITCTAVPDAPTAETQAEAAEITTRTNLIIEYVKAIDICPHRRGFFKTSYSPTQLTPAIFTEDEVATLIINDPHLDAKVSIDLEEICDRDFRHHIIAGTATAFLKTTDKKSRMPVDLVNDGFGVNQVVYMLTKLHRSEVRTLLIEEPEIHLHPTIITKIARTLARIVKDEKKQCVLATHSEQFVTALLDCVAENSLKPEDLRCYHVTKEKRVSAYEEQKVSESGQLEGGLSSFVEAELQSLKRFISATK